ncbi:hypothetical protein WA158_004307 [Blastocystis sp. Blastoise]
MSEKEDLKSVADEKESGKTQEKVVDEKKENDSKLSVEVVKSKHKSKNGWKKPKSNSWIYITNLPKDVNEDILNEVFSKYGIIQLNENGEPRIKLYRNDKGELKGDASICYLREESVALAIKMMDDYPLRYTDKENISVSQAVFEKKEGTKRINDDITTEKARKIRKIQQTQQLSWAESGLEDEKGLRIVVLENVFDLKDTTRPHFVDELESDMMEGCSACGDVVKITVFETNPNGIVVVKFKSPLQAEECVKVMNGRFFAGRQLKAYFWDGVTNYKVKMSEEEEDARLEAFAKKLEEEDEE